VTDTHTVTDGLSHLHCELNNITASESHSHDQLKQEASGGDNYLDGLLDVIDEDVRQLQAHKVGLSVVPQEGKASADKSSACAADAGTQIKDIPGSTVNHSMASHVEWCELKSVEDWSNSV